MLKNCFGGGGGGGGDGDLTSQLGRPPAEKEAESNIGKGGFLVGNL